MLFESRALRDEGFVMSCQNAQRAAQARLLVRDQTTCTTLNRGQNDEYDAIIVLR